MPAKPSKIWLCFVAVIVLQLAAWTAWFFIASKHKVAEVPLVKAGRTAPASLPSSQPAEAAR
jgi:hypothetical protein